MFKSLPGRMWEILRKVRGILKMYVCFNSFSIDRWQFLCFVLVVEDFILWSEPLNCPLTSRKVFFSVFCNSFVSLDCPQCKNIKCTITVTGEQWSNMMLNAFNGSESRNISTTSSKHNKCHWLFMYHCTLLRTRRMLTFELVYFYKSKYYSVQRTLCKHMLCEITCSAQYLIKNKHKNYTHCS